MPNRIGTDYHAYDASLVRKEGQLFVEVGSITGNNAIELTKLFGRPRVVVYEALPDNFRTLNNSLVGYKNVVTINKAVSDHDGESEFFVYDTLNSSSLYQRDNEKKNLVKQVTVCTVDILGVIENLAPYLPIDTLLLNCEGAEGVILNRIMRSLQAINSINQISVEFHPKIKIGVEFKELINLLASHYDVSHVIRTNYLFTRKGITNASDNDKGTE